MKDFSEGETILTQELLSGSGNNVNPNTKRLRVLLEEAQSMNEDRTKQDEIFREIIHLNESFRKARTDKFDALDKINAGYSIFIELRDKFQEAINFQMDMKSTLVDLQTDVSGYCLERKNELKKIMKDVSFSLAIMTAPTTLMKTESVSDPVPAHNHQTTGHTLDENYNIDPGVRTPIALIGDVNKWIRIFLIMIMVFMFSLYCFCDSDNGTILIQNNTDLFGVNFIPYPRSSWDQRLFIQT